MNVVGKTPNPWWHTISGNEIEYSVMHEAWIAIEDYIASINASSNDYFYVCPDTWYNDRAFISEQVVGMAIESGLDDFDDFCRITEIGGKLRKRFESVLKEQEVQNGN